MNRSIHVLIATLLFGFPILESRAQCTPAVVPYFENFGSGALGAAWRTESTHGQLTHRYRLLARPPGRIEVTDQHNPLTPAARPFLLAMDDPLSDPFIRDGKIVYNAALLCAAMGGRTGMYLHFNGALYSFGNARRPLSVYLSDSGGANFKLMKQYTGDHCPTGSFCPVVQVQKWVGLDGAAARAGLALTDRWVIGFEHGTDDRLPDDGVVIDSVAISGDPGPTFEPIDLGDPRKDHDRTLIDCNPKFPGCEPTPCDGLDCPYRLDFEARFIDPRVRLLSVNGGTTRLGTDGRGHHLRLQALEGVGPHTINVAAFDFAFSRLAQYPTLNPVLAFSWQALDRASNAYDGVYLSDDGGASYVRVLALDRSRAPVGEWQAVQLDLRTLAKKHRLAFTDAFVVAFAHYALAGKGRAGYALDDVLVGDPSRGRAGKAAAPDPGARPEGFALEAAYPNPFNPTTTLSFTLPEAAAVTLAVYDVYGREVARLLDGQLVAAGTHAVAFEAGRLASGTYVYRLTAGRFTATRQMVLLK